MSETMVMRDGGRGDWMFWGKNIKKRKIRESAINGGISSKPQVTMFDCGRVTNMFGALGNVQAIGGKGKDLTMV